MIELVDQFRLESGTSFPKHASAIGATAAPCFWDVGRTLKEKPDGRVAKTVELLLVTQKGFGAASVSYRVKC
ncbi:MAG: hypothetical protein ACI9TB_002264 [Parasphingorhabdus sp.]